MDFEGGRVQRFGAPFTQWPSMHTLAQRGSTQTAFHFGRLLGRELSAVGIHINFAPCLDVLAPDLSCEAIGDRSFGTNPKRVSQMGVAVLKGLLKSGILPCAKHFPGHGHVSIDSHHELPVSHKILAELQSSDLVPFCRLFVLGCLCLCERTFCSIK